MKGQLKIAKRQVFFSIVPENQEVGYLMGLKCKFKNTLVRTYFGFSVLKQLGELFKTSAFSLIERNLLRL